MEDNSNILTGIIGIVGVIIGATITPWVTNRIERIRHRHEIKANIIKCLHIFHNYWKMDFSLSNIIHLKMREANELSDKISQAGEQSEQERLTRKFDIFEKDLFRKSDTHLRITERKMEVESEIESLLIQVLHFFNQKKYNKLEAVLRIYLDESHADKHLHSYANMKISSFPKLTQEVLSQTKEKKSELNERHKKVIYKVQDLL